MNGTRLSGAFDTFLVNARVNSQAAQRDPQGQPQRTLQRHNIGRVKQTRPQAGSTGSGLVAALDAKDAARHRFWP